jgi:hypothetical protein
MEPDFKLDTDPINEDVEGELSSRPFTKDDELSIKKNLRVYNAYQGKFIKPDRSIPNSLCNTQSKSQLSSSKENTESKSKLHKISKDKSRKIIDILEK